MAGIRFVQGAPYFVNDAGVLYPLGYWVSTSGIWAPPGIANGTQVTHTFTLATAVLGNPVIASFSENLQALQLTAYVSAAGVITALLRNGTGSLVTLDPGVFRFAIAKFIP